MKIHRGDIIIVNLDPAKGSEQPGTRPCVILQNDVGNKNSPTTIVGPCTTKYDYPLYPFEVEIKSKNCPIEKDSVINLSQLRTISKDRIHKNIGSAPQSKIDRINKAIKTMLSLD